MDNIAVNSSRGREDWNALLALTTPGDLQKQIDKVVGALGHNTTASTLAAQIILTLRRRGIRWIRYVLQEGRDTDNFVTVVEIVRKTDPEILIYRSGKELLFVAPFNSAEKFDVPLERPTMVERAVPSIGGPWPPARTEDGLD